MQLLLRGSRLRVRGRLRPADAAGAAGGVAGGLRGGGAAGSAAFPRRWLNPKLGLLQANVDAGTDGLWWVEEYRRDVAFVRRQGEWFRITTREYGPYLAYPEQSFITYRSALGTLSVDNQAPLPPLIARAATLQSGRLAKPDGAARHTYVNIDERARRARSQEKLDAFVRWE